MLSQQNAPARCWRVPSMRLSLCQMSDEGHPPCPGWYSGSATASICRLSEESFSNPAAMAKASRVDGPGKPARGWSCSRPEGRRGRWRGMRAWKSVPSLMTAGGSCTCSQPVKLPYKLKNSFSRQATLPEAVWKISSYKR